MLLRKGLKLKFSDLLRKELNRIKSALKITAKFNIITYYSYFLECPVSLRSPLLTLDSEMKKIALDMGITILE